jgi:hypothetical protein
VLQRNGVRLVAEVVLLFVAAAIAGPVLHLGAWAIVGVVVVVWGAIAVFEYGRAHPQAARRPRPARVAPAASVPVESDGEAAFEHVRVLGSRPAAPAPGPPPVEVAVEARPEPEAVVEPEPEPQPAAAEPEPEPQPQPASREPEREAEPEPVLREPAPEPEPLPVASAPWSWNVWNLERVVRERAAANDELNYLLLYLREYANPAGMLPPDFDALVRESFGDLLAAPS